MKDKILATLPNEKHTFQEVNYPEIHIVDWKDIDKTKGVDIFNIKQNEINSVCLYNANELTILIDTFGENALPISRGSQASQCECISFPSEFDSKSWVLTIETKYANNEAAAFRIRDDLNYPEKMVSQIISTVEYFREKNIIDKEQLVYAIISFPNLVSDFNSTLFSFVKEEWSIENLIVTKKIRIKGCNSAKIITSKRIKLSVNE
ncbi:MAG TPA: hypothetical protein DCM02_01560 [Flavobacterium sp.]|nr:hypothetical protein [Flavobacterium sp.]